MSSLQTHFSNFPSLLQLKQLPHKHTILHTNVKIDDIWTLKVFFNTECPVGKPSYEVQIFRSENNVWDTPFMQRTFLKDISQVGDFIENFQEWAYFPNLSFDDLKFVNDVAVITKNHPEFLNVTCNFKVIARPQKGYFDCSYYEIDTKKKTVYPPPPSQVKFRYCKKNDVTHYMRWFTEWLENYHEVKDRDEDDSYMFWISEWTRM